MAEKIRRYKNEIILFAVGAVLVVAALVLASVCDSNRALADKVFLPIASVLSFPIKLLTGWVPFSLFECAVILVVPVVVTIFVLYALKNVKKGVGVFSSLLKFLLRLLGIAGICFFAYYLLFSLPGRRTRMLDEVYGGKTDASVQQLYELTVELVEKSNETYTDTFDSTRRQLNADLKEGYRSLHEKVDYVGSFPASVKPVMLSKALSYADISGIFFCLTQEANFNTDSMPFTVPYTMAHEMAHSVLIVSEAEANFVAFLVSLECDNEEIVYSGYFDAMIYCLNALGRVDDKLFREAYSHMSAEVYADIIAQRNHLAQYEGPVKDTSNQINDWSIKVSGQPSGIKSYGEVVDLLLAWYLQK